MADPVLDLRALNRATLARQHLLDRTTGPAPALVEHLAGLQAQAPWPPYFGLWSRLEGFTSDELVDRLERRELVRTRLQRGTVHLVTADDARWLHAVLAPLVDRFLVASPGVAGKVDGIDLDALAAAGREVLDDEPATLADLGDALAPRWPDRDPKALGNAVALVVPVVQVPPRALWGRSGPARWAVLETWVGAPVDPEPDHERLVRRYLAAFGPASALDVQQWCGLTGLGPVVERLRPELVAFRDTEGRELFDLPDAPRPGGDAEAPVRLVAGFDNLLLGHADRRRVFAPEHKPVLFPVNGVIPATVLVDGFVAGTWRWTATRRAATVAVTPFGRWPARVRRQVEAEAERLLAVAAPEVPAHEVTLDA